MRMLIALICFSVCLSVRAEEAPPSTADLLKQSKTQLDSNKDALNDAAAMKARKEAEIEGLRAQIARQKAVVKAENETSGNTLPPVGATVRGSEGAVVNVAWTVPDMPAMVWESPEAPTKIDTGTQAGFIWKDSNGTYHAFNDGKWQRIEVAAAPWKDGGQWRNQRVRNPDGSAPGTKQGLIIKDRILWWVGIANIPSNK